MAFANLLTLIDDIASLLDDVAVLTKTAGAKTAGVLGDDLALNAQQVSGVRVDRELPVVWAVFKGSLLNKSILVPLALAISAFAPWLVTPLLTLGGLFLCFEGAEKLLHSVFHGKHGDVEGHPVPHTAHAHPAPHAPAVHHPASKSVHGKPAAANAAAAGNTGYTETGHPEDIADTVQASPNAAPLDEKTRVRGAIRTDFILSAEIIAITLGTVQGQPLLTQVTVMALVAVAMTVGVYGVVAAIVKLDDLGLYLSQLQGGGLKPLLRAVGRGILRAAPWLMKGLSVAGTIAMFLVGGGIVVHGFPWLHHQLEHLLAAASLPGWLSGIALPTAQGIAGLLAGTVLALVFMGVQKLRGVKDH